MSEPDTIISLRFAGGCALTAMVSRTEISEFTEALINAGDDPMARQLNTVIELDGWPDDIVGEWDDVSTWTPDEVDAGLHTNPEK